MITRDIDGAGQAACSIFGGCAQLGVMLASLGVSTHLQAHPHAIRSLVCHPLRPC